MGHGYWGGDERGDVWGGMAETEYLVAGLGKVACNLLVDLVDVLVLVLRPAVGVGGGTVSGHVEERDLEGQLDRADAGTWNGRERDACGRT